MAPSLSTRPTALWRGYPEAALMIAASTLIGLAIAPRWGNAAVDMLYLPTVLAAAALGGLGPALFAALAAALAYNYFFTAPHFSFRIDNPNDVVTVLVLFGVALVTSKLAASIREQRRIAEAHAARNATIAGLARALLGCTSEEEIGAVTTRELGTIFRCNAVLVAGLPEPQLRAGSPAVALTPSDIAVAAMVLDSGERAGRGVDRALPTEWQFHPVRSGTSVIAAVGLARDDGSLAAARDQLPLLDNLLDQAALALERARLEAEARAFAGSRERDTLRATLLASIGQDLRPPLKAIADTVAALRREGAADRTLIATIGSETGKLERHLDTLLDLEPDTGQQALEFGDIRIDLFHRAVSRTGAAIHLAPKEYAVLAELAKHPGRVLTHAHLLRAAWGPAQEGQVDYLRVAIRALRQKLEDDPSAPQHIVNEPAVGYRLRVE